jgi:hypothetical protein
MPKRTINTRSKRTEQPATEQPATLGELLATTEQPAEQPATTEQPATEQPATTEQPAAPFNAEFDAGTIAAQFPATTTTEQPATVATVATTDAKAEFLNRKATATTSAVSLYAGASLAVHRSDRQPADAKYIERVASPVQKIGPNGPTPRDNSFMLSVYDFFVTYRGSDFAGGFNPAQFGADLGTTSRAASVGYLSTDLSDIYLTEAGIERGANLAGKRAKAAAGKA